MSKDKGKKEQSKLEVLAGGLQEEAVRKKVLDPSRNAFQSYDFGASQASSYDQFKKVGSGFVKHYMAATGQGEISDDRADALFNRYMASAFEQEGGIEAAYEAAQRDLFGAMEKLSNRMQQESRGDYTKSVLGKIDPTDFGAHKEIAGDIIKAMSSLYPGMKTKSPDSMAHNWRSLALNYAGMRDSAKNLVGDYKAA